MKGHSCYAMCGAGAALGERAANTVWTDTRQDGQALGGSQRPKRVERLPKRRNLSKQSVNHGQFDRKFNIMW